MENRSLGVERSRVAGVSVCGGDEGTVPAGGRLLGLVLFASEVEGDAELIKQR